MVFRDIEGRRAASGDYAIETLRGIAVLLLIAYHVVGAGPSSGLERDYPDPLRIAVDALVDVRMPFFAFIAGWVYGLRPATKEAFGSFLLGKIRRLWLPATVAAMLFAAVSNLVGTDFSTNPWEIWTVAVWPYAHFWFVQAILVIFATVVGLDALLGHRFTPVLLAISIALYLAHVLVTYWMSTNFAFYLLPYFLLGLVFVRNLDRIETRRGAVLAGLAVLAVIGFALNVRIFLETGQPSTYRHDIQSLTLGFGVTGLAVMLLPHARFLEWIGPYSFTIYLYHVFGTAGARMALTRAGVDSDAVLFFAGLAAGLAVPVAVHLAAARWRPARILVLGRKR